MTSLSLYLTANVLPPPPPPLPASNAQVLKGVPFLHAAEQAVLNRLCRLGAAYASVLEFVDETDAAPGAYLRAFGTALDGASTPTPTPLPYPSILSSRKNHSSKKDLRPKGDSVLPVFVCVAMWP